MPRLRPPLLATLAFVLTIAAIGGVVLLRQPADGPRLNPAQREKPEPPPAPAAAAAAAAADTAEYPLTGVVRSVDRESGFVAIRHDAIPDYNMPAMTMPFNLEGQPVLADVEPGDKVRGTLRVDGEKARLVDVEITELATAPEPAPAPSNVLKPGEVVPDFTMTTQDGDSVQLSDLRGKVVVLTFIYTRCPLPDFCPLMDRRFAELADMLRTSAARERGVRLVSLSFDPEHDTPEVLSAHARMRGATPPLWTFAVASHDELRKVAGPLGMFYGPGGDEIIHSLSTAVIGPDGRLVRLEKGRDWTARDLLGSIVGAIPAAK